MKRLFFLTFIASLGTFAFVQYDRLAKIDDAEQMVTFRKKVFEGRSIRFRTQCVDMRLLDETEAELHKAEKRLGELRGDSRPQFGIRDLLWLTMVVAVGCAALPPLVRNYGPRWGNPAYRVTGKTGVELHFPTGRVEVREDNPYGHLRMLLEDLGAERLSTQL